MAQPSARLAGCAMKLLNTHDPFMATLMPPKWVPVAFVQPMVTMRNTGSLCVQGVINDLRPIVYHASNSLLRITRGERR